MRRNALLVISLVVGFCGLLISCSKQGDKAPTPPLLKVADQTEGAGLPGDAPNKDPLIAATKKDDAASQDKYEAALTDALSLLADRKYPQALDAFESARTFQDSDFIRTEITKLKTRIDQEKAATKTVQELE